jgi:outer membrane biosynthesis protein TonB
VRVSTDPTLARVGWFLENRSRDEYPSEVRQAVAIDAALDVAYPAAALAAHREGTVLAWLAVGTDGAVTELNIVSGDDDFSLAVADALGPARLKPATDIEDHPIPFWAVLEFDFRLDGAAAPGGTVAAAPR